MPSLKDRLETLKAEAAKLGYRKTLDFPTDRGDQALAAVCWGIDRGAPTARVLLTALPDENHASSKVPSLPLFPRNSVLQRKTVPHVASD